MPYLAWRRALVTFAVMAIAAAVPAASAQTTTTEVYGDYSMMFSASAGQYWSGGQAAGQWAWSPQSASESRISWGDPAKWPPSSAERFVHVSDVSGDWVTMPGWFDNGTYYTVKVTMEWQAAADCRTGRQFLPAGGAQHYVRWTIPTSSYCLYAEGTVTEQLSGRTENFVHEQVWFPSSVCPSNSPAVSGMSSCITQWESWSDDNGSPMALRLERTQVLAKGLGMAYEIRQTYPVVWSADMRYAWTW